MEMEAPLDGLLIIRSIMVCPGGTGAVFYARFLGKKRIFGEKGSLLHPNMAQGFFFPLQSFLGKPKEKLAQKAHVNTE